MSGALWACAAAASSGAVAAAGTPMTSAPIAAMRTRRARSFQNLLTRRLTSFELGAPTGLAVGLAGACDARYRRQQAADSPRPAAKRLRPEVVPPLTAARSGGDSADRTTVRQGDGRRPPL